MNLAVRSITKPLVGGIGLSYCLLLVVLLVLNHMSPLVVLAMTLGAGTLVGVALRPYLGLHAFIMLLFVERAFVSKEGVTAIKLIGMVIFCGWLLSTGMRRKAPIRLDPLAIAILSFVGWAAVTAMHAIDTEVGLTRVFTFAQLGTVPLMFISVVDEPEKLRGVFRSLVVWSFVATSIAIAGYYLGITPYAVGVTGNRNLLATYINIGIVCAFLLYLATTSRVSRVLLLSALPVFFLGLAVTLSRTGLIVLGITLLLIWYRVARQKNYGVVLGSVLIIAATAVLLPVDFYRRAGSIVPVIRRQEETFGTRVRLWKAGLRMIEDKPLLGVGPGNFARAVSHYNRGENVLSGISAHNTYVGVAAEMGLVGLGIFGLVVWFALQGARRAMRSARSHAYGELEHLAVIGEAGVLVMMMAGITGTVENLKMLWLLIGVCAALGRVIPGYVAAMLEGEKLQEVVPRSVES